jgi:hypothetical protein
MAYLRAQHHASCVLALQDTCQGEDSGPAAAGDVSQPPPPPPHTALADGADASRAPAPARLVAAWRGGAAPPALLKTLAAARPDLAPALNERVRAWLLQDCERHVAEGLLLFVLPHLRRDWLASAKNPGAFLMSLLQHRAALLRGGGLARRLLDAARANPQVAPYMDSDVLQELGDMDPGTRAFIIDEYVCKQRTDWPGGLRFPSQCLLSCMRSIRHADPALHAAYSQLLESRPDLAPAMNGVVLYGLAKARPSVALAAVERLQELPESWTRSARVNASAFLYNKVLELCGAGS